jgi:hypothetical protein
MTRGLCLGLAAASYEPPPPWYENAQPTPRTFAVLFPVFASSTQSGYVASCSFNTTLSLTGDYNGTSWMSAYTGQNGAGTKNQRPAQAQSPATPPPSVRGAGHRPGRREGARGEPPQPGQPGGQSGRVRHQNVPPVHRSGTRVRPEREWPGCFPVVEGPPGATRTRCSTAWCARTTTATAAPRGRTWSFSTRRCGGGTLCATSPRTGVRRGRPPSVGGAAGTDVMCVRRIQLGS